MLAGTDKLASFAPQIDRFSLRQVSALQLLEKQTHHINSISYLNVISGCRFTSGL